MSGNKNNGNGDNTSSSRLKIVRLIKEYSLEEMGEELERRWLATDESGMSLRELADFFNKSVLESAIARSQLSTLDIDTTRIYTQLTDEDVSSGVRTRTERRLERNGVDVSAVKRDFVTHQSVHTYLREYRDAEKPEVTPEQRRESAIERIQKLQSRTAAVTQNTVEGLQRSGVVPEGDIEVVVDIQVLYPESGNQFEVYELLEENTE